MKYTKYAWIFFSFLLMTNVAISSQTLTVFEFPPINYIGLALIIFGTAFVVTEVFVGNGMLAAGGIIVFVLGSFILFEPVNPIFNISPFVIAGIGIIVILFCLFIIYFAIKARTRPVVSGREQLIGSVGKVIQIDNTTTLWLRVQGELWQIQPDSAVTPGQKVVVTDVQGLVLSVKPI